MSDGDDSFGESVSLFVDVTGAVAFAVNGNFIDSIMIKKPIFVNSRWGDVIEMVAAAAATLWLWLV